MPIYEYLCGSCGKKTEVIQRMNASPLKVCPHCGGKLKKMASAPAFHLKGSGWYKTDYAAGGGDSSRKSDEKAESGEKADQADKSDKGEKADKAEKSEKSEKSEKTEKSDKAEKSEKSDKADKPKKKKGGN
jgi:putative FmdB family regulatory protein